MTVNEYVKKRFGRFMDQCTNEEIYVALLEYVKEAAKEAEKSDFQRECEMAERVTTRKNNGGSARAWETMFAKYQSKCESILQEISDYEQNEPKNPFLPLMRKRLYEAQEIFTILKK